MCNDYRQLVDLSSIEEGFQDLKIRVDFPEGRPNLEPRADVRITDVAPIMRGVGRGVGDLVQRRWSWPGPAGKPVYNFRSDGRSFGEGRCLIIADGFYEFTAPTDPKKKRKDKWLFTMKGRSWFCIAGIWRSDPKIGEAFTMLTMPPGPDIEPYHDRQIVILDPSSWIDWLDPSIPAQQLIRPLPVGTLEVAAVG
ncbi:SOS response-associated peptidase [uncultured Sphingomonas sp.]|uniref:SOS response-associated peptidase n=1 Tax=uncultured Sphingomonas sp. TaxID=158754 RepID=UPI0026341DA2|nr:SOS response-associated peptidase [uncultured Sphingomonas sp.]